jgi:hypothetical protein
MAAHHSQQHTRKSLSEKTFCVCFREDVGADFERRESKRASNRAIPGADVTCCGTRRSALKPAWCRGRWKQKRPTERGWALHGGGAVATGIQPTLSTIEQSRAILRVVVDAMAPAMNAGQSVQGELSPCPVPIDR